MKKIVMMVTMLVMVSSLVACTAQDAFSVFEKVITTETILVDQYETIQTTDLNDQSLNQLSFENVQALSTTLETDDLTNTGKIAYIRALYQDIQMTHAQNILLKYEIKDVWAELKINVTAFKDAKLTLNDDDKTTLADYKMEFALRRLEVQASIGSIKTSLEELKGLYDLDHLDLIIDHFESILDVLTMRQNHMVYLKDALIDVNTIALSYFS